MSKLYRVKADYEYEVNPRSNPDVAKPMTFRFYPRDRLIQLTKRLQWYWFGLNNVRGFEAEKIAWQSYVDAAFTEGRRLRDSRDYISGLRLSVFTPLPKMIPVVFGLNYVRGYEAVAYELAGWEDGTELVWLETIRLDLEYPDFGMTWETDPTLIHVANIITPKVLPDGTRQVNAFTQRGGREGLPVFYPLWSYGPVCVPKTMLNEVPEDTVIELPYNPI